MLTRTFPPPLLNLFLKNISQLVTVRAGGAGAKTGPAMRDLGIIADGGVLCRQGRVAWVGAMQEFHERLPSDFPEYDGAGTVVLPGFVDSHTHMMFAGSREKEFALRSSGATYL
ncbi:MAG TPA: imidazolonepropionase, partial [Bacteroidota bacterium]|nr:imidazolonepropionase [Bacteroidota bacterium]